MVTDNSDHWASILVAEVGVEMARSVLHWLNFGCVGRQEFASAKHLGAGADHQLLIEEPLVDI